MDGWRRRGTRRSFCSLPGALHAELHNVAYLLRIFVPSSHLLMVLAAPTIKQPTNQPTSSSGVEWLLELLPLLVLRRLVLLLLLTDLIYHFRSPQNKIIHRRSIAHHQTKRWIVAPHHHHYHQQQHCHFVISPRLCE